MVLTPLGLPSLAGFSLPCCSFLNSFFIKQLPNYSICMSHLFPAEPPTETLSNQEYTAVNTKSANVEHCKCLWGASTEYHKFSIKISNASKAGRSETFGPVVLLYKDSRKHAKNRTCVFGQRGMRRTVYKWFMNSILYIDSKGWWATNIPFHKCMYKYTRKKRAASDYY